MEDWDAIINPTFTDVRNCFKEITECLIDEGCRFKIERTYGKGSQPFGKHVYLQGFQQTGENCL